MQRNRTIVHVDDDPALLRLVAKWLQEAGFEVVSLENATKLHKVIAETGARLVLLDVDLPNADGLELLREVKARDGGVQVVMLTGLVGMGTVLRSMRWGAEGCVFKPLTGPEPLLDAVEWSFAKMDRWWAMLDELTRLKDSLGNQGVNAEKPQGASR